MEIGKTVTFVHFFLFLSITTYSLTGRSVSNNSHTIPLRSPVRSAFSQNQRRY